MAQFSDSKLCQLYRNIESVWASTAYVRLLSIKSNFQSFNFQIKSKYRILLRNNLLGAKWVDRADVQNADQRSHDLLISSLRHYAVTWACWVSFFLLLRSAECHCRIFANFAFFHVCLIQIYFEFKYSTKLWFLGPSATSAFKTHNRCLPSAKQPGFGQHLVRKRRHPCSTLDAPAISSSRAAHSRSVPDRRCSGPWYVTSTRAGPRPGRSPARPLAGTAQWWRPSGRRSWPDSDLSSRQRARRWPARVR